MSHAEAMLETHPRKSQIDVAALTECIEACFDCAQSCTACADACLGEDDLEMLVRCIRLNLDCADVCDATGRLLSRHTEPDWSALRAQLEACAVAAKCAARSASGTPVTTSIAVCAPSPAAAAQRPVPVY
jgi:hypothetical protein